MKSILFTIALSSLLSLAASSGAPAGAVNPALEEICSKTIFPEKCSSSLVKFIVPGKIDTNAALLAGLKALDSEITVAISEANKLSKEKPTGNAGEELMVGMSVYSVVSNCTKKAQQAIQANQVAEYTKEIKLASEVTGDLMNMFQGAGGKKDVMKDRNFCINQLAQINYNIVMKSQTKDQANPQKEEEKEEDKKTKEEKKKKKEERKEEKKKKKEEDKKKKEEGKKEDEKDDEEDDDNEEEEDSATASAYAPGAAPSSAPMAQPPKPDVSAPK